MKEPVLGRSFHRLPVSNDGMFDNVGKSEADEPIGDISAGPVEAIGVVEVVTALGGRAQLHDLLEAFAIPRDGRIEPGIGSGFDVDKRREGAFGGTVLSSGAIIEMCDVKGLTVLVGVSLGRTGVDMDLLVGIVLMVPHADALWA